MRLDSKILIMSWLADKGTETRLQILFDDGKNIEETIHNKNN